MPAKPQKPNKSDLFLSLNETVEVVDHSEGLVINGKYYYIESDGYGHKVINMRHKGFEGIDWLEVNE